MLGIRLLNFSLSWGCSREDALRQEHDREGLARILERGLVHHARRIHLHVLALHGFAIEAILEPVGHVGRRVRSIRHRSRSKNAVLIA